MAYHYEFLYVSAAKINIMFGCHIMECMVGLI